MMSIFHLFLAKVKQRCAIAGYVVNSSTEVSHFPTNLSFFTTKFALIMPHLHFREDVSGTPLKEYGHRRKECHYKKFIENRTILKSNAMATEMVYVHIRICQCHYDRKNAPDRSQMIHHGRPKRPVIERNGIEFHLDSKCGWINLGSVTEPTLKRVCVTACGRYQTDYDPPRQVGVFLKVTLNRCMQRVITFLVSCLITRKISYEISGKRN